jgi:hypothetical protein
MTLVTEPEPITAPPAVVVDTPSMPAVQPWSVPTRIAFRFCTIYFSLYILFTQMFSSLVSVPGLTPPGAAWSVRTAITWIATRLFAFPAPLSTNGGSGDKPYDFAFAAACLALAAGLTLVWSGVDRRRLAYPGVQKGFRLFLRFALGATMLSYGMATAFPLQMPYPNLTRLLEPYGNFSLMGVLWAKLGASPAYEMFTGFAEVTCAVLLFIPGLTTLGALMTFITTTQIFTLNMTYDVPVKLFSFHLILMSLFLLAPDVPRLFRAAVLRRGVGDAPERPLAIGRSRRRAIVVLQLALGGWLIWSAYGGVKESYYAFGAGAPRPALYGIWQIEKMTIDGVERAPLITDYDRWRRMVIQNAAAVMFQRMDDTFQGFGAKVDADAKTITFTRGAGPQAAQIGLFTFDQPSADRLVVEGTLQGKRLRMETRLFNRDDFLLMKSRFRWMQDVPFNR